MSEVSAPAGGGESSIESSAQAPAPTPEYGQTQAAANQAAAEKQQIVNNKKKYNLKVNGKDKDFEIDLSNDDEVRKYLQRAVASDEKFQEAAMTRKQMEYLVDQLRTNPLGVLQHEALGINVKELAQKVMEQELEDLSKSPEQKRIEELEKKLKGKEEREKTLEDEKRQEQMSRLEAQQSQALDDSISAAISNTSLPKSPYTVKRVVDTMINAIEMGYDGVTAEQVMPFVEEQIMAEIQRMFESSPDEVMEKLVSKKRLDGYRKARVSKSKEAAGAPQSLLKQAIKDVGAKPTTTTDSKKQGAPLRVKDLLGF